MYKMETRSIEIRLADDPDRNGPGILQGTLMPYGETASDRQERFEPGSLYWPEGGVVLREMHDRKQSITRFEPTATDAAVELRVALPDTQRGRDAVALVRNGTLRGLSVEFRAERESYRGGLRVIHRARLYGAGLVDDPAYSSASVEVRHDAQKGVRFWL